LPCEADRTTDVNNLAGGILLPSAVDDFKHQRLFRVAIQGILKEREIVSREELAVIAASISRTLPAF
jgi:hypothetical protein